ncbi:MAG: SDR family oxidoreductase [Ahrensia sp.]
MSKPIALVTGGAKRVGRAIVEDLAANGFCVGIHANSSLDAAQTLADTLGDCAFAVHCDLNDTAAAAKMIDDIVRARGPINLLVNNASTFEKDELGALDSALWDTHFAVHVKTPAFMVQQVAKHHRPGTRCLVVNIIDQRVWRLTPNFFSYTASKAALWAATQTMAQALAPSIRVNAIGPGPTLKNVRQAEEDFQQQIDALPLQRGPALAEFGATIRYLWNAPSVTGQMIALDGGQHLAWETPDVAGINE